MNELFSAVVAGSVSGGILLVWFCWGLWRLQHRGEDGLGRAGWAAITVPLLIVLFCLFVAKAGSAETLPEPPPMASTVSKSETGARRLPAWIATPGFAPEAARTAARLPRHASR